MPVDTISERPSSDKTVKEVRIETQRTRGVTPSWELWETGGDKLARFYLQADGTFALQTNDGVGGGWVGISFDTNQILGNVEAIDFDLTPSFTSQEGRVGWDADEGTLIIGMPGGNIDLQVGQENLIRVTNKTGSTIAKGKVVYINGAQGQRPTIDLADRTDADKIHIEGITAESIDNNQNGFIMINGLITEIDTSGTPYSETWADGDKLYLGTAGGLSNVHPTTASDAVVIVGHVTNAHASTGHILLANVSDFSIGNNFDGILRQSVINKNTGTSASCAFTAVNDAGHRSSLSMVGSNYSVVSGIAESLVLYNQGYNKTVNAVDGNYGFEWWTDVTDSHALAATSKMDLSASGTLSIIEGLRVGASPLTLDTVDIDGSLLITHTSTFSDDHVIEIDVNAAGYGDVEAIDIAYATGAIASGAEEAIILINVDESAATGGDIFGLEMIATEGSADAAFTTFSGVGVGPIEQLAGTFGDADTVDVNGVDQTTALSTGGAGNITLFVADNDYLIVGDANKFQEIEAILDTGASGSGIRPTFEYSTGVGTWASFTPIDGTNQFRNTGVIVWLDSDIPSWAVGTGSEYLIRITRTKNSLSTSPIADLVKIAEDTTEYFWDKDGRLCIQDATLETLSADPSAPSAGRVTMWVSDGSGSGDAGDVMSINSSSTVTNLSSGGGGITGPGSSTDNAVMRWDGTGGGTAQDSLVTIADDGTIHCDMTAAGDVLDYWFTGQSENSSEQLKIGFNASNGNHHWAEIESVGNADLGGSRNRSLRFNCRTTKDSASSGYSAPFVVNVENYTGAAALVNANAVSVTNADTEIFYIRHDGYCESQGGFHYDGGGTDSCVYGSGAGVDSDEPRCTSIGVSAICYGDDAVAIGYNAAAGGNGSTAYQNNVVIGSGAASVTSSGVAVGYQATTNTSSGGTVLGSQASVSGNSSVAIGTSSSVTGAFGVAIGAGTSNSGSGVTVGRNATGSMAIGYAADSSGHASALALGTFVTATAAASIAIGYSTTSTNQGSIVIGRGAADTASRQLVIGSDTLGSAYAIDEVYIGNGVTVSSPNDIVYNAPGGSGTDIAAGDLVLAGGKSTGNATPGEIKFQASSPGSSGTSLQTLADKLRVGYDGTTLVAQTNTPGTPASGECVVYMKGSLYIIAYDDSGTVRYKYLDLSGTGVTWTHTTTAP